MSTRGEEREERGSLAEAAELLARAEPPAVDPVLRQRQIQAALAGAMPREQRRPWGIWALGLAGVGVAILIALWVTLAGPGAAPPSGGAVLLSGTLEGPAAHYGVGDRVELREPLVVPITQSATLRLDDGSEIELEPRSKARLSRRAGWKIVLTAGRTRVRAQRQGAGRSLRVRTPEAMTKVVGTRFDVERDPARGTTVRVSEGRVQVAPRAERQRHLVKGPDGVLKIGLDGKVRRLPSRADGGPAAVAATLDAKQAADSGVDAEQPGAKRPAVAQIRRQIRGGRIARARALIRRGRKVAQGRRRYLAELAIVEAEADLAEKRYPRAIRGYLQVSRRFRGTPQAEAALFAAGQLALDHDRPRAGALLRRYQRRFPKGRFAKDTTRLLKLLEHAP